MLAKHDALSSNAESFVAIAAFFTPNRTNQHKRKDRMFEDAFSARHSLLKSVASLTLKR
jgi:hypothetical protein